MLPNRQETRLTHVVFVFTAGWWMAWTLAHWQPSQHPPLPPPLTYCLSLCDGDRQYPCQAPPPHPPNTFLCPSANGQDYVLKQKALCWLSNEDIKMASTIKHFSHTVILATLCSHCIFTGCLCNSGPLVLVLWSYCTCGSHFICTR